MTKTARLYGGSLYDLASEEKLTEEMLEQLDMVRALFKEEPSYLRQWQKVRKSGISHCLNVRLKKFSAGCT